MYVFHNVLQYDPGCILLLLSVSGNRVEWSCRLELFIRAAWCSLGTPFKLLWTETGAQATLQECMNTEWEREKSKSEKKRERKKSRTATSSLGWHTKCQEPSSLHFSKTHFTFDHSFRVYIRRYMTKKCLDNSNGQTKPTQLGRVVQWCTDVFTVPPPSPASKSVS